MATSVGPVVIGGAEQPTHSTPMSSPTSHGNRDPSYVGISCTNYGYADYSRQSRNFSPVSRVPLDPPPEGATFATALTNNAFSSLSAVCSPVNEVRIETVFESANGGKSDRPSIIAQRIESLYGEKTKEEFKKRSKSAGPLQRSPYEPSYKAGLLELSGKIDLEKEELRPSNFPKSVKEKTAFVEKLIKKDVREGVKPLEELKKPPKFEIPSRAKSEEYYRQQREIEKQKALLFSQRLKEAEQRRKAQEAVEAEKRRQLEEEQRKLEPERPPSAVETIPQYSKVECEQVQVVELVNTSLGSNDSLADQDDQETVATDGSSIRTGRSIIVSEDPGTDEVDSADGRLCSEEVTETHRVEHQADGTVVTHTTVVTKTSKIVTSSGESVEEVFVGDSVDDASFRASGQQVDQKQASIRADSGPQSEGGQKGYSEEAMAGVEFLTKLDEAEERIRKKVHTTEEYLKETHSEEIHGRLRAAIGKGNLLIAQKCKQFRGLCEKNLREPAPGEFPTTRGDLEGFWDMIVIQIDQVLDTFDEIEAMRANGWKEVRRESPPVTTPNSNSPAKKKLPNPLKPRNGASSAEKQREEARKRLLEAKRAAKERNVDACAGDLPS